MSYLAKRVLFQVSYLDLTLLEQHTGDKSPFTATTKCNKPIAVAWVGHHC